MFLQGEPAIKSAKRQKQQGSLDIDFDTFIEFLQDIFLDPKNRQRNSAIVYEEAKQCPNQSIQSFVAYLETLEEQLESYTEEQKANHLLAKIQLAI